MLTRTNLISVTAGTFAALLLGGTAFADESGQLGAKTHSPSSRADDVAVPFEAHDDWQTFHRGAGDLTADPAGTCYGHTPTIKAVAGFATIGTAGSDVIVGTDGPDVIFGLGGDDIICGFDGNDIIYGDTADPSSEVGENDTINGGMGNDTIFGGPWQDFLFGSAGNDTIHGDLPGSSNGFADNIEGGNGNDTITGGPGNDLVWGDRQDGGYGHDTIDMVTDDPSDHDEAWAGRGNDTIYAEDGKGQNVWGQSGRDTCHIDEAIDVWSSCEVEL
ncbi:MAG: calcium-binding protein [Actinomycetota bacterium]